MVTRTVVSTELEVLCMDIEKAHVITKVITLTGYLPADNKLLKIAQKKLDTDTLKATYIKNAVEQEILYGMSETEFIKIAKVLPPRGTSKAHIISKDSTPKPKSEVTEEVPEKILEQILQDADQQLKSDKSKVSKK